MKRKELDCFIHDMVNRIAAVRQYLFFLDHEMPEVKDHEYRIKAEARLKEAFALLDQFFIDQKPKTID